MHARAKPGDGGSAVRRALRDASGYVWVRAMQGGTALVASVALSHALEPAEFGKYAVAIAIATLAGTILFNWISSSAFRFYSDAAAVGALPTLTAASLWAFLWSCGVTAVILFAAIGLGKASGLLPTASLPSLIAGIAVADAILSLYKSVLMAQCRISRLGVFVTGESILRWGGALAAVVMSPSATALLCGQLVGLVALSVVVTLASTHAAFAALVQGPPQDYIRRMFVFGAPLAGSSLSAWVTSVADRIMLAGLVGAAQAGVYAAGYQIASNIILLPASVVMAGTYPVLLQEYRSGGREAAAAMLTTLTRAALIAGIATVIVVATGTELIVSALGRSFHDSAGVMPIVAAAQLVAVITEYYAKSFQLTNQTARLFVVSLASAIVTIVANLLLIPTLGMRGSAVATLAATMSGLVLTILWGRPLLRFELGRGLTAKLGISIAISSMAAILLRQVGATTPAAVVPVLCFGVSLIALREDTTLAALRLCTGRTVS